MSIERFWNANVLFFSISFLSLSVSFASTLFALLLFFGQKSQNGMISFILYNEMEWLNFWNFFEKNLNQKSSFKYGMINRLFSITVLIRLNAYRSIFVYFLIFLAFIFHHALPMNTNVFPLSLTLSYSITWYHGPNIFSMHYSSLSDQNKIERPAEMCIEYDNKAIPSRNGKTDVW